MVRTGVVAHPSEWSFCGYNEIQEPKRKNVLINYQKLTSTEAEDSYQLREAAVPYIAHFGDKKEDIGPENTLFLDV